MGTGATLSLLSELNRLESLREPQRQGNRRSRRYHIRGDAELHPAEGSRVDRTPIDVKLRDVGRGGLGFVCEQRLVPGTVWRCSFLVRDQCFAQQALVIRYCREVQDGLYLVGGQFCIDPGVMIALGVDPHELAHDDGRERCGDENDNFQSPGAVHAEAD